MRVSPGALVYRSAPCRARRLLCECCMHLFFGHLTLCERIMMKNELGVQRAGKPELSRAVGPGRPVERIPQTLAAEVFCISAVDAARALELSAALGWAGLGTEVMLLHGKPTPGYIAFGCAGQRLAMARAGWHSETRVLLRCLPHHHCWCVCTSARLNDQCVCVKVRGAQ